VAAAVIPTPVEETAEQEPEPEPPPVSIPATEPVPVDEPVWTPPPASHESDIPSPGARPPRPGDLTDELTDDDLVLPPLPPRPGEDDKPTEVVPPHVSSEALHP